MYLPDWSSRGIQRVLGNILNIQVINILEWFTEITSPGISDQYKLQKEKEK